MPIDGRAGDNDGLVQMLVHDLRTPLTGMRLYIEMLRADAEALEGAAGFVELLDEAGAITNQMTSMVSDLLDASRLESRTMPLARTVADSGKLVREAVELVAASGRKRQVDVDGDGGEVTCDPGLIRRVLANLIANAVDFSPENTAVRVHMERAGGMVRIATSDEGPGIPAQYQGKIFEKFGQLEATRDHVKYSSGLDLTFCRLAVQAHGGQIGVESEPGQGSTFWFTLPAMGSSVS